jgi:hypothetical protein
MAQPSKLIYDACIRALVTDARDVIARALGITELELADGLLPDQRTWVHASTCRRSAYVCRWLIAECAAVGDQSQVLRTVVDPLHAVGTRD